MHRPTLLAFAVLTALLSACTTSPLNRNQLILFPEAEMALMGEQLYSEMKEEMPVSPYREETAYVQCVADYVIEALPPEQRENIAWETTVFDDESANAFALPGGKIGVNNGLLTVALNQHQLAAVMAHEVGHVLARHSNESVSRSALYAGVFETARALGAEEAHLAIGDELANLLGLSFSREQETEADLMGVMLMADAGFDPQQSIDLWQNMAADDGGRPPEFFSTHPAPDTRMDDLRANMDAALVARAAANNRGLNPDCVPPRFRY